MKDLLTPSEVAEYLGVTQATLTDWRYRRRGPEFLRVGRLIRYRKDSLLLWLDEVTVEMRGPPAHSHDSSQSARRGGSRATQSGESVSSIRRHGRIHGCT